MALKKRHLRGRHDTLTPAIAVFLNHHIGILKWSPETTTHVLGLPFKTIYNWLNAGRLKLSLADLPDKGIVESVNLMVDDKYLCMVVRLKRDLKV